MTRHLYKIKKKNKFVYFADDILEKSHLSFSTSKSSNEKEKKKKGIPESVDRVDRPAAEPLIAPPSSSSSQLHSSDSA